MGVIGQVASRLPVVNLQMVSQFREERGIVGKTRFVQKSRSIKMGPRILGKAYYKAIKLVRTLGKWYIKGWNLIGRLPPDEWL